MIRRMRRALHTAVAAPPASTTEPLPRPMYVDAPNSVHPTVEGVERWYYAALATAPMIGERSTRASTCRAILELYERLEPDDYITTLRRYCAAGLDRYGDDWRYADLVTSLYAAAELIRPQAYFEIGVRRGRSMAAVAAVAPKCHVVGFDRWIANYGGMENPGPTFIEQEMRRIGHTGVLELVSGDSRQTVPDYLGTHPDAWFDIITVDGDHSAFGAAADLAAVLPRLRVGGALLFDDIAHPKHRELAALWQDVCGQDPRFSHWEYPDLGYGVGIAVRKY